MKEVTYRHVDTLNFPNVTARIYVPNLSEDENERRKKVLHNAAAAIIKEAIATEKDNQNL